MTRSPMTLKRLIQKQPSDIVRERHETNDHTRSRQIQDGLLATLLDVAMLAEPSHYLVVLRLTEIGQFFANSVSIAAFDGERHEVFAVQIRTLAHLFGNVGSSDIGPTDGDQSLTFIRSSVGC